MVLDSAGHPNGHEEKAVISRNPCLNHPDTGKPCELLHEDKNCDRCIRCDYRVLYSASIATGGPIDFGKPIKEVLNMENSIDAPIPEETKTCKTCLKTKPVVDFQRHLHGGRISICKECNGKKAQHKRNPSEKIKRPYRKALGDDAKKGGILQPVGRKMATPLKPEPAETGSGPKHLISQNSSSSFYRLAALLSAKQSYDREQIMEIRDLCEQVFILTETYLNLHSMFSGQEAP